MKTLIPVLLLAATTALYGQANQPDLPTLPRIRNLGEVIKQSGKPRPR